MPTIEQHLTSIHARLNALDGQVITLRALIAGLATDPLQQDIDLELPHASAGDAPGGAGGEATVETDVTKDALTVRLPAVTPERKAQRRQFAEQVLNLNETFPGLEGGEAGLTAVDCYERGGPMWLYLGSKEGRDHIISLPQPWRAAMVEDVAQDSTREAQEFGRDVLKDIEPSAGMEVSYDYLLSTVET